MGPPLAQERGDDALDLGAAVLPILLRTYCDQVAGGLTVLLVLALLVRPCGGLTGTGHHSYSPL